MKNRSQQRRHLKRSTDSETIRPGISKEFKCRKHYFGRNAPIKCRLSEVELLVCILAS